MFLNYDNLVKYKNNTLIIYQIDKNLKKIFTFSEVIDKAKLISKFLNKFNLSTNEKISLQFSKSPELIVLILSTLNDSYPFCPILNTINDTIRILDILKLLKSKYLFSEKEICELNDNIILLDKIKLFESCCYFYKIENQTESTISIPNHWYSIKTSGSTGEPKVVHVPRECIWPNILSLSQIYYLSKDDVIYVASPPTFDPFIVDVFLALYNGCSLFIASLKIELNKQLLSESLFKNSVKNNATVMCITPSIFKLFGCELIQKNIFANDSSLRVISFGGEPFPTLKEIRLWLNQITLPYQKRFYNIYGITEISCWATIQELKILNIIEVNQLEDQVLLGTILDSGISLRILCLKEENIKINGIGELLIGSKTRKCLLNDEEIETLKNNKYLYRPTGDIVDLKENKIKYIGRKNSIVKRYGNRVSLTKIENHFKTINEIEDAICIFENHKLILFLKTTLNINIKFFLNSLLNEEKPDTVLTLKEFPLSNHGKLSKKKLLEIYEKTIDFNSLREIFQKHLEVISGIKISDIEQTICKEKRIKSIWDSSYIELGGNSFQAINLLNELESFSNTSKPLLFQKLLNCEISLRNIFESIENDYSFTVKKVVHPNFFIVYNKFIETKMLWKFNTNKCIDATPSILILQNDVIVSVGSHSHYLVNIYLKSGKLLSSIKLLDRIESKVEFDKNGLGYLGCYDGAFYKFNPADGNILWKFSSNGMIKCKALYKDNTVIFGNYNENKLFALDSQFGTVKWQIQTDASILSAPLNIDENSLLLCTLNGTVMSVDTKNGTILHTCKLESPIFANAAKLNCNLFIIAEVSGTINFFNGNLNKIATFQSKANVFSSFDLKKINENEHNIVFGCYDHNIYNLILKITESKVEINLKWKCKLQSQIYATPKIFEYYEKNIVIACTTIGWTNILNLESSEILHNFKLNGEIFSSPKFINNMLIIGCRDNYLYCFEIEKNI